MHYDAIIIGAGMSGLAAGIRLAYFDKRVCIVEKHYAFGGLNSYYKLRGREFDVGLHAVTNYAPPERRHAPLNRLLRQLRLSREEFDLHEQRYSEVHFPGRRLRFTNDVNDLVGEVAEKFPRSVDRFRTFLRAIEEYDDTRQDHPYRRTRPLLRERLQDPLLIEMLLCPIMFYGNAEEHDMDFTQFVTMFKSLFCEGFARPRGGVRTILKVLVRKFRACGGKLRMNSGVRRIDLDHDRVVGVTLDTGERLTADVVLSSAGYHETLRLCSAPPQPLVETTGRVSFVETVAVLDRPPAALGHEATIVFFNDAESFTYARPAEPVDLTSGIICCPNNYEEHEEFTEGIFRLTWLANYDRWVEADEAGYSAMKRMYHERFVERGAAWIPGFRERMVFSDMFTPRTIQHYTGHMNGAVYGAPVKRRDGRTPYQNLWICGTDQGFLGIIGAMLSGITMVNQHVLARQ